MVEAAAQVEMKCRAGHRYWQPARHLAHDCPTCDAPGKRTGRFINPKLLADAPRPWSSPEPFLAAIDTTVEHEVALAGLRFGSGLN